MPAHYAIVDALSLIPSHDPATFKPSAGYPANVQERDYQHDKNEKLKVMDQVSHFNPAFVLTDNPDPVNGPPMILANGLVMGGNSRAMTIQTIYGRPPEGSGPPTRAQLPPADPRGRPSASASTASRPRRSSGRCWCGSSASRPPTRRGCASWCACSRRDARRR